MTRVLLPLRVLAGEAASPGLVELLAPAEVVLLGYHVIPEQTAPSQARLSFEDRAAGKLDEVEAAFVAARAGAGAGPAAGVERTLVFTHDADQTIQRVAEDERCDAVAYVNPSNQCERVLVVLHGDIDAARVATVTAGLIAGRDIQIGILEVTSSGEGTGLTERALAALDAGGVERSRVHEMALATDSPASDIALAADDYDATVLGEREPSLRELVFGELDARVVAESLGPVLVVRRADPDGS